ncbi:MAG: CRISPR-associated ring nuclease [Anaerolineae bacterium]|nr:CRISPR-associated ring nuclease [Anaerolineae bacterium]
MQTKTSVPVGKVALITMGGQAQVVTFAVDALLAMGESLSSVLVLHLSPEDPRVRRALAQLSAEFAGGQYQGRPLEFRRVPVQAEGRILSAITEGREAETVWALARDLLARLKEEGWALHICIAGGPRLLGLTLTTAAMLQCDHQDRLWHLYTPPDLRERSREGKILHPPPDSGVRLIPIPFAPWGVYFPALRTLARPFSPLLSPTPEDAARCAAVWERLTERQREVLRVLSFASSLQEAAEQLGMTLKTLDTHKSQILAECRAEWEMSEGARLTYHFLREKFGPWLQQTQR